MSMSTDKEKMFEKETKLSESYKFMEISLIWQRASVKAQKLASYPVVKDQTVST